MIYTFDSYYSNNTAKTICVGFENWTDSEHAANFQETIPETSEYVSGEFYKRELPCILSLLEQIALKKGDIIVIDGYVHLDDTGKLGLGGYLYEKLDKEYPIIGVAKNDFVKVEKLKIGIERGGSVKKLFITSAGIDLATSAEFIKNMHGEYRIPTLLKLTDSLTRE